MQLKASVMGFVKASTAFMKLYTYLKQLYHVFKTQENQIEWMFIWHGKQINWDGTVTPHLSSFQGGKKKMIKWVKVHKCSAQRRKIRTQRDFVTVNLRESFLGSVNP